LVGREEEVVTRSEEEVAAEELRPGYLARRLVPQQAVTRGEQVALTRADQLEGRLEQQEQEEQEQEREKEEQKREKEQEREQELPSDI
jgi:hypothetical protein